MNADELRRAAIADIDNILIDRAHLRGRLARLEAVIRHCARCTIKNQTPGPVDDGSPFDLADDARYAEETVRRLKAEAERDRLRAAIAPLRPYRVAIRANDEHFQGAGGLADAILGAVSALDVEEGT